MSSLSRLKTKFLVLLAALALTGFSPALAAQHIGDKVAVTVSGSCCYNGTIVSEGTGAMAGYFLIHFDNPASLDQYAKASNVAARTAAPGKAAPSRPDSKTTCVMGTIGGKPACFPVARPR